MRIILHKNYRNTKKIFNIIEKLFADTPLPGTNLGKDAKSLYNLSSSLGSDAVEHGKDIYNVLKADSWKLPKQVATGVGLTYVPESAESLIANIKDACRRICGTEFSVNRKTTWSRFWRPIRESIEQIIRKS